RGGRPRAPAPARRAPRERGLARPPPRPPADEDSGLGERIGGERLLGREKRGAEVRGEPARALRRLDAALPSSSEEDRLEQLARAEVRVGLLERVLPLDALSGDARDPVERADARA